MVPQTAQPSVSAQIVSNSYMVQATLKGGATTTDLKVKVPVFITPPSVVPPTTAEPFYSAPPPEWQPTQVRGARRAIRPAVEQQCQRQDSFCALLRQALYASWWLALYASWLQGLQGLLGNWAAP